MPGVTRAELWDQTGNIFAAHFEGSHYKRKILELRNVESWNYGIME